MIKSRGTSVGEIEIVYTILVGNLKGRDHLEWRPNPSWEDNIKMDLRKTLYDVDSSRLSLGTNDRTVWAR